MEMKPAAAIVGCGLIGEKRARALAGNCRLMVCCDTTPERAERLAAANPGAAPCTEWRAAATSREVDVVFVATTHDMLAPITLAAVTAGKHVLVEKPAARRAAELEPVLEAIRRTGALVRVGFNHRYHRAFRKAREIYESGDLGELMFVRARYGHGGRPGYDKEWRAIPELSGGGEAIDQGMHIIDLARWFLGDFPTVDGFAGTFFWNTPVEDNAFFLLRTAKDQVAFLHATWTEWKNTFSFEVSGRRGKLEITGLGGSYGVERLAFYQMQPGMGPPDTVIYEYPMADDSWEFETAEFIEDIRRGRSPNPGLPDAIAGLQIIEEVYRKSQE
jgi:predicted dehydrogenase